MDIAVIGGGHGSYAAAAHLSETGHRVRLWRRDGAALAGIAAAGEITLTDWQGTRAVPLAHATNDAAAALAGAELVVIALPATAHAELAPQLAPLFADGQVVFLPPGTFGSYIFAAAMRDAANTADVAFAETGTLPYLARKQDADHVRISVYATRLPTGVFPAAASTRARRHRCRLPGDRAVARRARRRADERRADHPSAAHLDECRPARAFRGVGHPQRGHPAVGPACHRRAG